MIRLTGLWKNTDKNGKTYFSGRLSPGAQVMIMENSFKEKPTDPDMNLFIVEPKKEKDE